jgi:hypothetical protein
MVGSTRLRGEGSRSWCAWISPERITEDPARQFRPVFAPVRERPLACIRFGFDLGHAQTGPENFTNTLFQVP